MSNQHNGNNHTDRTVADQQAADQPAENNPLMAVYNAQPPQPEQPARFYWQEPWRDAAAGADDAIQAAFEN